MHDAQLFLKFPHLPAQIEQHLNPSAVARKPFLLLAATAPTTATTSPENEADPSSQQQKHQHQHQHHYENQHVVLLDVSPEAEAQGIDTTMTLSHITTHFPPPAVIQIPAATWAAAAAAAGGAPSSSTTSFSQSSLPPLLSRGVALAAYKEAAEKAPVRLLRKLVEGEGLVLLEEEHEDRGNGNTTIGNYRVALSLQETSSALQQEQQEQHAKDLGQYLSAELERLLGYQLIFEVEPSKGEASDSSSKSKRKEATAEQAQEEGEEEEEEDANDPGAGAGEDEALEADEEVEVEVVEEYICEHCRAFFFDAAALLDHVEKTHLATNNATKQQQQPLLPPSSAASTTMTKTRPSSRGGNPLPPPPPPPPQVLGPGTHFFIEALTTLTDQKDIEAFLTRIGAPLPAAARAPSPPSPG